MKETPTVGAGSPRPFGAQITPTGVNFAIFSRNATSMRLCVFASATDSEALWSIALDPRCHRTGDIWHLHVDGLSAGALYAWRADGPFLPERGYRFNPNKLLIDPYAKALSGSFIWDAQTAKAYDNASDRRDLSFSTVDDAGSMPKCIVVDDAAFDWEGDRPLNLPLRHCVIYEAHVRGLSALASEKTQWPGCYRGVIDMIPYLR
ncbi:MAG TPA: glycogen debranching enzyme, partial [Spirochaetales bacterium]|nr:glycogen debranching enzyme [Spirochaetales bacterium]